VALGASFGGGGRSLAFDINQRQDRGQYLQLVRSAPAGAVFSIRAIPLGMNI
jgi:hypothetical protein